MPETIILTGTLVASSIGCTLVGCLLRAALKNASQPLVVAADDQDALGAGEPMPEASEFFPVRGYDTPELGRGDLMRLARGGAHRIH